ncbi:hypothetical protein [Paraclostridium bifermentans]|uniref:hypothetical protein n=1 Tax=Paraclostridium bifermentans TaxID=1490 RepID=UPI0024863342|nr:hypothetical protein [Paraclostridium bifermentans]
MKYLIDKVVWGGIIIKITICEDEIEMRLLIENYIKNILDEEYIEYEVSKY